MSALFRVYPTLQQGGEALRFSAQMVSATLRAPAHFAVSSCSSSASVATPLRHWSDSSPHPVGPRGLVEDLRNPPCPRALQTRCASMGSSDPTVESYNGPPEGLFRGGRNTSGVKGASLYRRERA